MLTTGLGALRPQPPVVADDIHTTEYAPNGDPVLSPSQLSTFLMCPRKWAARYIHGIPDPPGQSAQDGVRMHKVLEKYYKHGVAPDNTTKWGAWASTLLAKTGLPLPGPGVEAERKFKFELNGVWWRGSKDLSYDDGEFRVIRDHKSTAGLEWAKTEEQLLVDPQSDIYAYEEYLNQDHVVRNDWGYVTREKHPKTLLVSAPMPYEHVAHAMREHTASGKRILQLYRDKPEINALEPVGAGNGGCSAFGGCKLDGNRCKLSPQERLVAVRKFELKRKLNMSQLDDMKARARAALAAKTGIPTAVAVTAATAPAAVVAPAHAMVPAPAPAPEAAATPAPAPTMREKLAALAAVAPPVFTPPADAPAPAPAAEQPRKPAVGRAGAKRTAAPVPPVATPATPARNEDETGAYTQAEIQAAIPAAKAATDPPAPMLAKSDYHHVQEVAKAFVPLLSAAARAGSIPTGGYELFINCAPAESYTLFSQYVAIVHAGVKELAGVETYAILSFQGTAQYQDCLRQALENSPPSGALVVDSRTSEGRDALSILERHAYRVVRGF